MSNWPPSSILKDEDIEEANRLLDQADALLRRHRALETPSGADKAASAPVAVDDDDLPILTEVVEDDDAPPATGLQSALAPAPAPPPVRKRSEAESIPPLESFDLSALPDTPPPAPTPGPAPSATVPAAPAAAPNLGVELDFDTDFDFDLLLDEATTPPPQTPAATAPPPPAPPPPLQSPPPTPPSTAAAAAPAAFIEPPAEALAGPLAGALSQGHTPPSSELTELLILLDTEIARDIENWINRELPHVIASEYVAFAERIRKQALSHMRSTLMPALSDRIAALLEERRKP